MPSDCCISAVAVSVLVCSSCYAKQFSLLWLNWLRNLVPDLSFNFILSNIIFLLCTILHLYSVFVLGHDVCERERERSTETIEWIFCFFIISLSLLLTLNARRIKPTSIIMSSSHYCPHHHHCSHFIPTQVKMPSLRKRLLEKQISPRNFFHVYEILS